MTRVFARSCTALLILSLADCGGKSATEPSPSDSSVTLAVGSGTTTLETIGETKTLSATSHLSNGSTATRAAYLAHARTF